MDSPDHEFSIPEQQKAEARRIRRIMGLARLRCRIQRVTLRYGLHFGNAQAPIAEQALNEYREVVFRGKIENEHTKSKNMLGGKPYQIHVSGAANGFTGTTEYDEPVIGALHYWHPSKDKELVQIHLSLAKEQFNEIERFATRSRRDQRGYEVAEVRVFDVRDGWVPAVDDKLWVDSFELTSDLAIEGDPHIKAPDAPRFTADDIEKLTQF